MPESTKPESNASLLDHKPTHQTAAKQEPTIDKEQDAPENSSIARASGQVAKITTTEVARSMILKYATELLGKDRAKEFFMQLGFLMRTNPKVAQCTPESIFNAMMQSVNLDLMPNTPEHYCSLVPYGRELQFQLEYRGGIELAYRSGTVKTIKADVVFAEDEFDYDDATNYIHHKKDLTIDRTNARNIVAAYAVAKLQNGELMFEIMAPTEIAKIKDKAVKAKNSGTPWAEWEERMVRKTPLKRLFSTLPNSRKDNRFNIAAAWDSANEGGKHLRVDMATGKIIDGELASLPTEVEEQINNAKTAQELQKIINGLSAEDRKLAQPLIDRRIEEVM